MSRGWRVAKRRHAALDGEGARLHGGRWNSKGTRVVYLGGTKSIAVLEVLVHLDPGILPPDLVSIEVEIPDRVIEVLDPTTLPANWRELPAPAALQAIGDAWIASARSVALRVPSAVVPEEPIILLNPAHPDLRLIKLSAPVPYRFDPRLRK